MRIVGKRYKTMGYTMPIWQDSRLLVGKASRINELPPANLAYPHTLERPARPARGVGALPLPTGTIRKNREAYPAASKQAPLYALSVKPEKLTQQLLSKLLRIPRVSTTRSLLFGGIMRQYPPS